MAETGVKEVGDRRLHTASSAHDYATLRYTALLFAAALLFHGADHTRRGFDVLTREVYWGGTVLALVALVAIALALVGHRHAPFVAVAVGPATALAVSAAHLLPPWSAFSDAFPGSGVDALSWSAALSEIGTAIAFGAAGAYVLYRRQKSVRTAQADEIGKYHGPW